MEYEPRIFEVVATYSTIDGDVDFKLLRHAIKSIDVPYGTHLLSDQIAFQLREQGYVRVDKFGGKLGDYIFRYRDQRLNVVEVLHIVA